MSQPGLSDDHLDVIEARWLRQADKEARRRKEQNRAVRHVLGTRRSPRTDPRVGDLFPFDPKGQPDVTVRVVALSSAEVVGRWRSKGEVFTFRWNWHWWSEGRNKPEKRSPVDVLLDPWPGDFSPWGVVDSVGETFIYLDSGRHVNRDDWCTADPLDFRPG